MGRAVQLQMRLPSLQMCSKICYERCLVTHLISPLLLSDGNAAPLLHAMMPHIDVFCVLHLCFHHIAGSS